MGLEALRNYTLFDKSSVVSKGFFHFKHFKALRFYGRPKKKLSPRQVRFVEFYCSGMTACEAYRKAGYEGDPQKNAWIIQENSGVRQAIDEKLGNFVKSVEDAIKQTAMDAFENAKHIMNTAENEFARLKASQDIMDRAGLKAINKLELEGGLDNTMTIKLEGVDISRFPKKDGS